MCSDEMPQIKQDCLLAARRTDDFIFGFDGGSMLDCEERVRAGVARSVKASEVDWLDWSSQARGALVSLHNG